jgi:hypothetical protein
MILSKSVGWCTGKVVYVVRRHITLFSFRTKMRNADPLVGSLPILLSEVCQAVPSAVRTGINFKERMRRRNSALDYSTVPDTKSDRRTGVKE